MCSTGVLQSLFGHGITRLHSTSINIKAGLVKYWWILPFLSALASFFRFVFTITPRQQYVNTPSPLSRLQPCTFASDRRVSQCAPTKALRNFGWDIQIPNTKAYFKLKFAYWLCSQWCGAPCPCPAFAWPLTQGEWRTFISSTCPVKIHLLSGCDRGHPFIHDAPYQGLHPCFGKNQSYFFDPSLYHPKFLYFGRNFIAPIHFFRLIPYIYPYFPNVLTFKKLSCHF